MAIAAGSVVGLLAILVGGLVFGATVTVGQLILDVLLSTAIATVYNFFIFAADHTRIGHVQFEDDSYYYYVEAVPKMNVSTSDVRVQKIDARKHNTGERNVY